MKAEAGHSKTSRAAAIIVLFVTLFMQEVFLARALSPAGHRFICSVSFVHFSLLLFLFCFLFSSDLILRFIVTFLFILFHCFRDIERFLRTFLSGLSNDYFTAHCSSFRLLLYSTTHLYTTKTDFLLILGISFKYKSVCFYRWSFSYSFYLFHAKINVYL